MLLDEPCPECGTDYRNAPPSELRVDGRIVRVSIAFQGALGWSEYTMLQLMHREWLRPLVDEVNRADVPAGDRPSSRALIVLLFWTYFETLMSAFYDAASAHLPRPIAKDLLKRYGMIGTRLDKLHRIFFGSTYAEDLALLGYKAVGSHLRAVQRHRNAFVHGNPAAIDDALVEETARIIPSFHAAWIACFNHRCAGPSSENVGEKGSEGGRPA